VVTSDTYPPTRVDVSVLFGEELAGRGHHIDWILQSEEHLERAYTTRWGGGTVWVTPADRRPSLLSRVRKHLMGIVHDARVFPLLRSGRYDVVEVKDKFLSGLLALIAARWYHKRLVYWLSYPFPEHYLNRARDGSAPYPFLYRMRGNAFAFLLYRVLLPAADHVFVQSEQMRRDVQGHGIAFEKMTAVPMGVRVAPEVLLEADTATTGQSCASESARQHIPAAERCFLYLGSLGRERRIDFLLRVLQHVRRQEPDARLYLIGKAERPEEEQFLIDEARRLGVHDAVVFVGQLPRDQALQYVREADVCVSPIDTTPMLNPASPTKLVEYMVMGKAVVANTHPDQRLVIEESGGGYCVPWDEEAFAAAVVRLMRDPQLALAMGERGRRYAIKHRSYQRIADQVELALRRVADQRGSI
jgi:glycosyltransferase involved in cell wall biosynthesis